MSVCKGIIVSTGEGFIKSLNKYFFNMYGWELVKTKQDIIKECLKVRKDSLENGHLSFYGSLEWASEDTIYNSYVRVNESTLGVFFDAEGNEWHLDPLAEVSFELGSDVSNLRLARKFSWRHLFSTLHLSDHISDIFEDLDYIELGMVKEVDWNAPLRMLKLPKVELPEFMLIDGQYYAIFNKYTYLDLVSKLKPTAIVTTIEYDDEDWK